MISHGDAKHKRTTMRQTWKGKRFVSSLSLVCLVLLLTMLLAGCTSSADQSTNISGHISISGSTALQPLVAAAQQAYQKNHPDAHIDVTGGGSVKGLQDVTTNKTNIGDSDIYADPATFPDPNLTDHIVCVTPFVVIVNPDVNINSLSRQQIIDIFSTGKVTNWSQLGDKNIPVNPVVRPITSGTRATFRKYILNGLDEIGKIKLQVDNTKTVVNTVATTPGAIGYAALSAVTPQVKYLSIDGQEPTNENITNGRYNFWSYEHMYTLGDDNMLVHDFITYMTSQTFQGTVQKLHYIPINDMNLQTTLEIGGQNKQSDQAASMARMLLNATAKVDQREATRYVSI